MTISSTTNRVTYTGNDTTATYSYTFRVFLEEDLTVLVRNTSTDVETTLAISTDYTVTGVGSASGGTIVLQGTGKAWQGTGSNLNTGYVLVIRRVVGLTQGTDIRNQGDFFPEVHEDFFDKAIMVDQQQQDELDRAIKLSESIDPATFDTSIPPAVVGANNLSLVVNATGDGFAVGPTASDISSAAANATAAAASASAASTSETNAEAWAVKTDGIVESTDYSSKAWAIGGTGVTDTATRGAAKEWAVETASAVDGTEYSAKEYAQGTQTRGVSGGGSSKDWATYTGGTVDDAEYSAKYYAQQAEQNVLDAVATQSITGSSTINHNANARQYRRVTGNGGAVSTSTTPFGTTTTNFTDGMEIVLVGTDNTNTVTIPFNDATSGALINGSATLGRGDCLTVIYDATLERFIEKSRNF